MAASLLERIPVEEITVQAREARPGRAALTVVAAVLFGAGWLAARLLTGAWLALVWSGTAVRVGWQAGRAEAGVRRGAVSRGAA